MNKKTKQQQNRASTRIGRKMSNDNMALNNRTANKRKKKKKAASLLMGMAKNR